MPPPAGPTPSEPRHDLSPSLRPAPVPKEFVQALRKELRSFPSVAPPAPHELARGLAEAATLADQMARVVRPSELPPPPPEPKLDPAMERAFRAAIEEMAVARSRVLEGAGSQLATLAAVIARRVIARELSMAPEILEDLVREIKVKHRKLKEIK
jgi:flagellar biosynthesis/type III secretory pathway protein FliH